MNSSQESISQHLAATERVAAYLMARDDTFAVSRCSEDTINGDSTCTLVWYVSTPNGVKPARVLVRGDRFNTGNLYFETSHDANDDPGGSLMLNTTAHYLFYYILTTSELYIIRMQQFKDWMMSNIDSFEARRVAVKEGENYRVALGRYIPFSVVEQFPNIAKEII